MRTGSRLAMVMVIVAIGGAVPCAEGTPQCPADVNADGMVNSTDISAYLTEWLNAVNSGGCPAPPAACPVDVSGDGMVNSTDISAFLTLWLAAVNAGGCPSAISLSVSPTTGGLGELVTLTINPSTPPSVFGPLTTAQWSGRFVPMIGAPTSPFTVIFSASEVREFSASQAHIILGSGSGALPAGIENLGPGVFEGGLSVVLDSGAPANGPANLSPATSAGRFESVLYPDGPGGLEPPRRNGELSQLPIMMLSLTQPNPSAPPAEALVGGTDFHLAIIVRIRENTASLDTAPATVTVDVVSYTANGAEFSRLSDLQLSRVTNDGDPDYLIYQNDLAVPAILVDTPLQPSQYPGLRLLHAPADGSAAIVPSM